MPKAPGTKVSHRNPANKRITFRPGTFSLEFVCAFVLAVGSLLLDISRSRAGKFILNHLAAIARQCCFVDPTVYPIITPPFGTSPWQNGALIVSPIVPNHLLCQA